MDSAPQSGAALPVKRLYRWKEYRKTETCERHWYSTSVAYAASKQEAIELLVEECRQAIVAELTTGADYPSTIREIAEELRKVEEERALLEGSPSQWVDFDEVDIEKEGLVFSGARY